MILCSPQNVLASPAVLERVLSVCQQRKPKEVLTARAQGKSRKQDESFASQR